jgi:hypothetical protein
MPRFHHFSTRSDYEQLVASHEKFSSLYFVWDTFYYEEKVPFVKGLLSLPDLGVIQGKKDHTGPTYWIFPDEPKVGLRPLATIDGQKRFALDGSSFDVCLQFEPNGLFDGKNIICGSFETTNPIGNTVPLFREIAEGFSNVYLKSKYYNHVTYVGPEALSLQKQRYRLCASPHLPRADDFKVQRKP